MEIPTTTEHPLKVEIEESGLTLWMVRKALGGQPSEGKLSRLLNGIETMPDRTEEQLKQLLVVWKASNQSGKQP